MQIDINSSWKRGRGLLLQQGLLLGLIQYPVGCRQPGPEVIKLFSCSTQLSINNCWHFNIYVWENSILGLSEHKKSWISWYFYTYEHLKFHAQLSWVEHGKSFITSGPGRNQKKHRLKKTTEMDLDSEASSDVCLTIGFFSSFNLISHFCQNI